MEEEEEKILVDQTPEAVAAIMGETLELEIVFDRPGFLRKIGVLPKAKVYTVKPINLGTLYQICRVLHRINLTKLDFERSNMDTAVKFAVLNGEDLVEVVALAIHNRPGPAPEAIKKQIRENCTSARLFDLMGLVIRLMDVSNFTSTIILTNGMSLLKAAEIIAPPTPGDL